jgi:predicted dithiol-disulfide oxidoreductase (DUF899 family)
MAMTSINLPQVVSADEWEAARDELLVKEKEATHARDALAAERRRMPMTELSSDYEFEGPSGVVKLPDLFEGRRQLILYHFWFPPDGDPCDGCSMFADQISHLAHINARDTSVALVSRAPQEKIQAFKSRMGWEIPWYTVIGEDFQKERGTTEWFSLDVYVRDDERVFLTYAVTGRGVEVIGSVWTFLDLTPFGRQEEWEDTPEGRPQTPKYEWWRLHDEYDESVVGARS